MPTSRSMRSAAVLENHLADERSVALEWDQRRQRGPLASPVARDDQAFTHEALVNVVRPPLLVIDRAKAGNRGAVIRDDDLGTIAHAGDVPAQVEPQLPDADLHAFHCSANTRTN